MATSSGERGRLAEAMDDRRAELRLTWDEVAKRGRISIALLRGIRVGDRPITKDSEVAIEQALDWKRGSVKRILSGSYAELLEDDEPISPEVMAAWNLYQQRRVGGMAQEKALPMLREQLAQIEEEYRTRRQTEKRRGRTA